MPRFQTDLAEIFPPELMLEMDARNSVLPGETIDLHPDRLQPHRRAADQRPRSCAAAQPARPDAPARGARPAGALDGGDLRTTSLLDHPRAGRAADRLAVRYRVAVADGRRRTRSWPTPAAAIADEWLDPAETDPLLTFVGSGVPIWAIQGAGDDLALRPRPGDHRGHRHRRLSRAGRLLDSGAPRTDDDPATSAGLFVLTGELDACRLALGDRVRVSGKVREVSGQTLLDLRRAGRPDRARARGNALPAAVELDPPLDDDESAAYYEALEGMLVQVSEPAVAVGPTSKYGETPLVLAEWGIDRIMQGRPHGLLIFVDDGSATPPTWTLARCPLPCNAATRLSSVVGPLAFTYDNYKIEPIVAPDDRRPTSSRCPAWTPAGPDEFSIATFNVENLFDSYDPHPVRPAAAQPAASTASTWPRRPTPSGHGRADHRRPAGGGEHGHPGRPGRRRRPSPAYGYEPVPDRGHRQPRHRRRLPGARRPGDRWRAPPPGPRPRGSPAARRCSSPSPSTWTAATRRSISSTTTLPRCRAAKSPPSRGARPRPPGTSTLVERILAADPEAHVVVLGDLNSFYDSPPLDVLREAGSAPRLRVRRARASLLLHLPGRIGDAGPHPGDAGAVRPPGAGRGRCTSTPTTRRPSPTTRRPAACRTTTRWWPCSRLNERATHLRGALHVKKGETEA